MKVIQFICGGGAKLFKKVLNGKKREDVLASSVLASAIEELRGEADRFLDRKIPVLPFSLFKQFDTSGDRKQFEALYFERRQRFTALALAAWLWEKQEYITALEDIIWAICDEYSWCIPAHMDGASRSAPTDNTAIIDNRKRLDLFACETGFALAECCAMLDGVLDPAVCGRAKAEVNQRVIGSFLEYRESWSWELMENNWCAVCAGSVGGAALYLVEDVKLLSAIIQRLLPTLERYEMSFYGDGVCEEGLSYWSYGMSFYTALRDLLLCRCGDEIDLFKGERLSKIAAFQQHCYFPGGGMLAFSDFSVSAETFRLGLSCYLSSHVEGVVLPSSRRESQLIDSCGRFTPALRDILWAENNPPLSGDEKRCTPLREAQWLLCSGEEGTGFAAKGGHNGESHNHNDVGSFIYYKRGDMIFCDLGAGEYNRDYFSDKRYTIFCNQSLSHNVPIINGRGQESGKEYRARNCRINDNGEMFLDITGAYRASGLSGLERYFHFDIHTGVLIVRDTFQFSTKTLSVTERFVSFSAPLVEANALYIKSENVHGSRGVKLTGFSHEGPLEPVISAVTHRNHEGRDITVYTIDYPLQDDIYKKKEFSVEFIIGEKE